jgi:hypothetical protein
MALTSSVVGLLAANAAVSAAARNDAAARQTPWLLATAAAPADTAACLPEIAALRAGSRLCEATRIWY